MSLDVGVRASADGSSVISCWLVLVALRDGNVKRRYFKTRSVVDATSQHVWESMWVNVMSRAGPT